MVQEMLTGFSYGLGVCGAVIVLIFVNAVMGMVLQLVKQKAIIRMLKKAGIKPQMAQRRPCKPCGDNTPDNLKKLEEEGKQ